MQKCKEIVKKYTPNCGAEMEREMKMNEQTVKDIDKAFRALEAIEDIRAEIQRLPYQQIFESVSRQAIVDVVLEIIDKHTK